MGGYKVLFILELVSGVSVEYSCSTRSLHSTCKQVEQFPACVNPGNCFSYSSTVIVLSSKVVLSLMGFLLYTCTDWYLSNNSRGSSNADFWNILFAYLSLHILTALEFPNFDLCVFNHCGGRTLRVCPSCAVVWKCS